MFYRNFKNFKIFFLKGGKGGDGGGILLRNGKFLKGGKGGDGGGILFFFDKFLDYDINKYRNYYISENGQKGGKVLKKGNNGKSIVIRIPLKSFILDFKKNRIFDGNKKILSLLKGGRGGEGCLNKFKNISNYGSEVKKHFFILFYCFCFYFIFIGSLNSGKSTFFSKFLKTKNKTFFNNKIYKSYFIFNNKIINILDDFIILNSKIKNLFKIYFFLKNDFKIFFHFFNFFFCLK